MRHEASASNAALRGSTKDQWRVEEGGQAGCATSSVLEHFVLFVLSVGAADLDMLGRTRMCWFVFKRQYVCECECVCTHKFTAVPIYSVSTCQLKILRKITAITNAYRLFFLSVFPKQYRATMIYIAFTVY